MGFVAVAHPSFKVLGSRTGLTRLVVETPAQIEAKRALGHVRIASEAN